jgi:hypothetical protein
VLEQHSGQTAHVGQLVVVRFKGTREHYSSYRVVVDNTAVGWIAEGGKKSIRLPAGPHSVCVKIDWARSPILRINIEDGEISTVYCRSNSKKQLDIDLFRLHRYIQISTNARLGEEADTSGSVTSGAKWFAFSILACLILIPAVFGFLHTGPTLAIFTMFGAFVAVWLISVVIRLMGEHRSNSHDTNT